MSRPDTRITSVVFDFDGVLADTERLHLTAFQRVFADHGWTLDEASYFDRYLGYDDRGLVLAFNEDQTLGLSPADIDALVAGKGQVFADFLATGDVLFPGARACVERLAASFRLAIASGALREEIRGILGAADLLQHFPVIVSADDVTSCKPSPEPYLTAAQQLGVIPAACAAVEDSVPGLAAAKAAGMRTIGITTTAPGHVLTLADRVVARLDELSPDLFRQLGSGRAV